MKYYAYLDASPSGPYEADGLTARADFNRETLVQLEDHHEAGSERWLPAGQVPLLSLLMDRRDRVGRPALSRRFTSEESESQSAALEAARQGFERLAVRLEGIESALRGLTRAVHGALALGAAAALLLVARPWFAARPAPSPSAPTMSARPPQPAPVAAPKPAPAPVPEPPAPRPRPVVSGPPDAAAVEMVKAYLISPPDRTPCPRTLDEALYGNDGPARTPLETVDCWAWRRFTADLDALSAAQRWSLRKALKELEGVFTAQGGFEAAFPLSASARRRKGDVWAVELGRGDRLSDALSKRYGVAMPGGALRLRYEADLDTGAVTPITGH